MITSVASKWQALKVGMLIFLLFYQMKLKTSITSLKSWHFEASEDIKNNFKSQALHFIRIEYWNTGASGNPLSLIPTL